MQLGQTLPALSSEPGIDGIYIVYWWQDMPLGHLEIPATSLPLSAAQHVEQIISVIYPAILGHIDGQNHKDLHVKTLVSFSADGSQDIDPQSVLQQSLEWLDTHFSPPENMPDTLTTSVVVCTRDRPENLARCLYSLLKLSRSPEEIIVIDNAPSTDATRNLVSQFSGVRYFMEPRPGLDVARNTGVRQSSGEIIAYIDDDVEVHPGWLSQLHKGFKDPKVMTVTGLVLPAELDTEAQFLFETHWGFNRGYIVKKYDSLFFKQTKATGSPVWEIGAGANMAFRRRFFELGHDFDERLDVGAAGCSGDSEFWYHVLAEGWTCLYNPAAVVFHYHRREMAGLKNQLFYYMRGHVTALLIQFEKYRHWGNLHRLFCLLPKYYARLIASGCLHGYKKRYQTLKHEIKGCFSGLFFYLLHRQPK